MGISRNWLKAGLLAGSALSLAACSTYPTEPRYPIYPTTPGQAVPAQQPAPAATAPAAPVNNPYYQPSQAPAVPEVTHGPTASAGSIEGGGLPPAVSTAPAPTPAPAPAPVATPAPVVRAPASNAVAGEFAYVIQPGDTLSGVGRRFRTPVQTLIDLNGLDPRGGVRSGQRIVLPTTAVDAGVDMYAAGPAPAGMSGVTASEVAAPPPPRGNAPLPAAAPAPAPARTTPSAATASPPPAPSGNVSMQWPIRGEILRRFGPAGMGERNNGINIGAAAGAQVKAAADGTVAYVGDDIVGQGLTVLIVHRDGWRTVYSHLGSATVRDGARVTAGQGIGTVGLTAGDGRPSIHFEVRQMRGDDPVALDPLSVLPR